MTILVAVGLPTSASQAELSILLPERADSAATLQQAISAGIELAGVDLKDFSVSAATLYGTNVSVQAVLNGVSGNSRDVAHLSADILALSESDKDRCNVCIVQLEPAEKTLDGPGAMIPAGPRIADGPRVRVITHVYEITKTTSKFRDISWVAISDQNTWLYTFHLPNDAVATDWAKRLSHTCSALDLASGNRYKLLLKNEDPLRYIRKLGPKRFDGVRSRDPGTVAILNMVGVEKLIDRLDLATTGSSAKPRTFFSFKKLPKEIQAIIWNKAVEGRRLYAEEVVVPKRDPRNPFNPYFTTSTHIFRGPRQPTVAYACKDVMAHLLSKGKYELLMETFDGGHAVWFNKQVDVLQLIPGTVLGRRGRYHERPSALFQRSLINDDHAWSVKKIGFSLETFETFTAWAMSNVRDMPVIEDLFISSKALAMIPKKFVMNFHLKEVDGRGYTVLYQKISGGIVAGRHAIDVAFQELDDVRAGVHKARLESLFAFLENEQPRSMIGYPERVTVTFEFEPLPRSFLPHPLQ